MTARRPRGDGFGKRVIPMRAERQARRSPSPTFRSPLRPKRRRRSKGERKLMEFAATAGLFLLFAGGYAANDRGWLDSLWSVADSFTSSGPTTTASARNIPLCPSHYRRGGGGVTCVTDGDSGVENGEPWRLTTRSGGVDAPEVGRPECAAERTAGDRATRRLQSLMSSGYSMTGRGYDRYDRRLVVILLADGRDAGRVLIDEGLAQPWPNSSNPWC